MINSDFLKRREMYNPCDTCEESEDKCFICEYKQLMTFNQMGNKRIEQDLEAITYLKQIITANCSLLVELLPELGTDKQEKIKEQLQESSFIFEVLMMRKELFNEVYK